MAITDYHRAIFTYLEAYRQDHPEAGLTYSLRQKNKAGRPRNLYLFTGDDKYIDIGLYQPISNTNKTRSLILGIGYNPATNTIKSVSLAITYVDPHLLAQKEIYERIIDLIGRDKFKEVRENRFELYYPDTDWQKNIQTYLEQHKPIIDRVLQEAGVSKAFQIPQEKLEADIVVANQPTAPLEPAVKAVRKYTWIPFYRELCSKLLHSSTEQLIRITKQVLKTEKLVGLVDQDADGNKLDLTVIDPYTVLSFIRICGDDKRATLFHQLKHQLDLNCSVPTDWSGLYTDKNQWIWLFGYSYERAPDDIKKLWELYKQVEQKDASEDLFNQVLAIKKLSQSKLTEGLFSQQPDNYFPINSKTKEWLKKRKLPYKFTSYTEYISLLDAVEKHDPRPFCELSEEAYLESQLANTKYYCVGVKFGQESQFDRFIQEGIWENRNSHEKQPIISTVQSVPIGARLAAKATYTQGPKHSVSVLEIKAIGEVVGNKGDGHFLDVVWDTRFNPFKLEGKGSYQATIQEVTNSDDIQSIFFHTEIEPTVAMPLPDSNHPKNVILYGPPGTGKTYGTIDLAVDIVDGRKGKHPANKVRFDQLRKEGQIEFVTFHQNYSYEDFVTGLKPDVNGEELKFQRTYGVLYKMARRAAENYNAVTNIHTGLKPFEQALKDFTTLFDQKKIEKIKLPTGSYFKIYDIGHKSIIILKDTKDIMAIELDLVRNHYGKSEYNSGYANYYRPLISCIESVGRKPDINPVEAKNFVLIIDEINRANMSRVFGELITLLEDDKRLGAANELTVTLSSGESFALPPNLYLIGTMNTADKSLALLDIALRRRFEFVYTKPDPELLESPAKEILNKLNQAIRDEHKPADFLIGHAYFMGKDESQLPEVFNNRVIPLLMEYFNGKVQTVIKVLDRAGVEAIANPITDELKVSYVE